MVGEAGVDPVLVQLREQARRLVDEVGGPLRRLGLRNGEVTLEIEWHDDRTPGPGTAPPEPDAADPDDAGMQGTVIASPIVGTFYRAPEPGAAPFVEVGQLVEPGQVVGIVEAMKLMNNVTTEVAGRVGAVLVGNADPVEFGQPLIVLQPV